MSQTRHILASGLLLVVAACGGTDDTQQAEIAAELRALRTTLQAKATTTQGVVPVRDSLAQALTPLRDGMQALLAEQRALAERQLGLAQELQRWTQVVATGAGSAPQAELQALSGRLAGLEKAMAAQEARHAEVEALLRSALDRTADQLEVFLQRLEGTVPAAPTGVGAPVSDPAGKVEAGTAKEPGTTAASQPAEPRRGAGDVWWYLVGAGVLTLGWLAWRGRSRRASALAAEPLGGMDEGVEQIWAAAELLGEAVGRLRPSLPQLPTAPSAPIDDPAVVAESLGFDLDAPAPGATSAAHVPASAAPKSAYPAPWPERPETVLFVVPLASGDQNRALQALQEIVAGDPRVLRRPAPEVLAAPGRIAVRCCLLPSLPGGERANLEQRLRDAVA